MQCEFPFVTNVTLSVQANRAIARSAIMVSESTRWPLYFFEAQATCFPSRPLRWAFINLIDLMENLWEKLQDPT